jgi:hypothetical protein
VLDAALDVPDHATGVSLVPGAIELLGHYTELHNKVAGEIFRLGLATLLAPQAQQSGFIIAHDDPGVRAADERLSILHAVFPGNANNDTLGTSDSYVNTSGIEIDILGP